MQTFKTAKPLEQQYDAALARASRDGIRVCADFSDHWLVTASQPGHFYTVRMTSEEGMLDCYSCPCQTNHDKYLCKHIAAVFQLIVEQVAERAAAVAEAIAELHAQDAAAYDVVADAVQVAAAVMHADAPFWLNRCTICGAPATHQFLVEGYRCDDHQPPHQPARQHEEW